LTLGTALFEAILEQRSGAVISRHEYADTWRFIAHPDRRIHLVIPEMLDEWRALRHEVPPGADAPFILMAGERRGYNANQIYRDPAWRKVDPHGAMRMHPGDAAPLEIHTGGRVRVANEHGSIEARVELDDSVRRGVVTLPHGYGQRYAGGAVVGPEINRLTHGAHCDPLSRTPFHKYVPVHIRKVGRDPTGTGQPD
jgi:anaerobic selenocysteine-containing dehydrogenase